MLKEKIDEFYASKQTEKDRTHFYITDAGKCPRAIYFNFKKIPKKAIDARVMRVMDHGDYTHLRIISTLFSLGLVKATEIEIPNQEIIHGRADVIINLNGEPYVVEIKSINSQAFFKLEKPDPDHLKQIQLYLHYFKINKGIFIYENKNTQEIKEFIVEYDGDLVKEILEKFVILKGQIENDIVPSIYDVEPWRCRYCAYLEECKKYGGPKKEEH